MPRLSIVVAVVSGPYDLNLIQQARDETEVEIVLVEGSQVSSIVDSKDVKIVRVQSKRLEPEMRADGLAEASGERIAVIGDRYQLSETWMRVAASSGWDVISGCVTPPESLSTSGWAIYLAEYSHVAPPMERRWIRGEHPSMVAGNMVFAGSPAENFRFDPDLSVSFARPPGLKEYLMARYHHSRSWAAERSTGPGRFANAALRLGLPPLLLWRRARNVFSRRRYQWQFLKALPYLVMFSVVETAGEIAGYLARETRKK